MNIDGKIIILSQQDGNIKIEVFDETSCLTFISISMTPEQFVKAALGRLSHCDCEKAEVFNLDLIGKLQEHKQFEFPIPGNDYRLLEKTAISEVKKVCPEGWKPDLYFHSRDSFFLRNEKQWARCKIRRWIDKPETKEDL